MKRIYVKENASGFSRYYYADFSLTAETADVGYAGEVNYERLLPRHGEDGATLYMALCNMKRPPFGFKLVYDYLKISINPAVKWKEIEPQIIEAIESVHGYVELERESSLRRAMLALHRLLSTKN